MESQELLPEEESARRAGVTISTLRQFADFGFLSRFEENGEGRYRLEDLVSVFSLTDPLVDSSTLDTASQSEPPTQEAPPVDSVINNFSDQEFRLWSDGGGIQNSDESNQQPTEQPEPVRLAEQIEIAPTQPSEYLSSYHTERDDRLGTTYELLALNKRLREELKAAREERDWLRARLEKLEARTERDQMLLLAESQTIRQLVTQVEKEKRSIWSLLALPWSGSTPAK